MTYSLSNTRLEPVTRQIAQLASGTLSTMTGLRRYEELDKARHDWLAWEQARSTPSQTWQESWQAYQNATMRQQMAELARKKQENPVWGAIAEMTNGELCRITGCVKPENLDALRWDWMDWAWANPQAPDTSMEQAWQAYIQDENWEPLPSPWSLEDPETQDLQQAA